MDKDGLPMHSVPRTPHVSNLTRRLWGGTTRLEGALGGPPRTKNGLLEQNLGSNVSLLQNGPTCPLLV